MGLAEYMIISKPDGWTVLHDGTAQNDYGTKEAAFEAAVAAASLALRQGHEVRVSVPGRDAGNKTALGAKDPRAHRSDQSRAQLARAPAPQRFATRPSAAANSIQYEVDTLFPMHRWNRSTCRKQDRDR
jgi:hypothetical protein